jgi:UDP-N-acetylmuramoyl-tripeptide--D-alanyl-D-alanine ligase
MSVPFQVSDCVRWTNGDRIKGPDDTRLSGVAIDSRRIAAGQLFVAIVGPNHDAHRFIPQAIEQNAAALLVAADRALEAKTPADLPVVTVPDTTVALGALAAGHRRLFQGPLIAITGSSGKTTTKEMCAAILEAAAPCLKSEGNLNNEFGLPLSLLRREAEHQRVVVELGMNHRGEIARLAAIARPDIALVTNVGLAHVEFLGSREEIAQEKGDLYAALSTDGIAIVNLDDELAAAQAGRCAGTTIGYSANGRGDVRCESSRFLPEGAHAFELATPEGKAAVRVAGLGATTVTNATAAAAAALAAGVTLDDVVRGLADYRPPAGRMAPSALAGGSMLIDDSYNANPGSLRASLAALADLARGGRGIAVLGDMGELGDAGEQAHRDAGRWVAELGIDFLYALGDFAEQSVATAVEGGLAPDHACAVRDHLEAAQRVRAQLVAGDWVLVKGSRAMEMERVVQALRADEGEL